jgi:hypothetical protein
MRVRRLYPTRPRRSNPVTRPTAEARPRYRHVREPPQGVTDVSSSALPVRTLNPPPRRRMARTGLEHRGKTAPSAERMCTEGSTSFPGAAMPQSSRKTATRSRRSWMRDCIRNESSLSNETRAHPAHVRQEVVGSPSPYPRIPATPRPEDPAPASDPRLSPLNPQAPCPACHAGGPCIRDRSGLAHVGTGKPSGLRCEPGKVQFVVCFANGQHTAGTRWVHQREHVRSRAGTGDTLRRRDLQDKRARE